MILHFSKDLTVDSSLRRELAKPFGRIMSTRQLTRHVSKKEVVYAIGDVTLTELLRSGYSPKVGIFDYRTERNAASFPVIKRHYARPFVVRNRRGALSLRLLDAVRKASKSTKPVDIRVIGEEDLASLACIYFANNGNFVVYGLRGRGMVVIKVGRTIKRYVSGVLKKMMEI